MTPLSSQGRGDQRARGQVLFVRVTLVMQLRINITLEEERLRADPGGRTGALIFGALQTFS